MVTPSCHFNAKRLSLGAFYNVICKHVADIDRRANYAYYNIYTSLDIFQNRYNLVFNQFESLFTAGHISRRQSKEQLP